MKKYYVDRNSRIITTQIGSGSPLAKMEAARMETLEFAVVFIENGTEVTLSPGAAGVFIAKESGQFTDPAVILDAEWEEPESASEGYVFRALVSAAKLDELLAQAAPATLMAEIVYDEGSGQRFTQRFDFVVRQNIYRENEPELENPAESYPLASQLMRYVTAPADEDDMSGLPGGVAPTAGAYIALTPQYIVTIQAGETEWTYTARGVSP